MVIGLREWVKRNLVHIDTLNKRRTYHSLSDTSRENNGLVRSRDFSRFGEKDIDTCLKIFDSRETIVVSRIFNVVLKREESNGGENGKDRNYDNKLNQSESFSFVKGKKMRFIFINKWLK